MIDPRMLILLFGPSTDATLLLFPTLLIIFDILLSCRGIHMSQNGC